MSIKVQLAELCSHQHLPMCEYKKLPAFSLVEKESDIVEKLEAYRLPEITKLICGSDLLISAPWAAKYQRIIEFYFAPEQIDVLQTVARYDTASAFAGEILSVADTQIIRKFAQYYDVLDTQLREKRKEKSNLTKKINTAKKEGETTAVDSEQADSADSLLQKLATLEKRAEALTKEIDQLNRFLKKHKPYIEQIHSHETKALYADSDENRENAYRSLNTIKMPYEEQFLNSFISSGIVPEEFQIQFRNSSFVNRVMQCLDKGSFKSYAFPILLKLYDEGVIDLIEGPASDFIDQHPAQLCDYLVSIAPQSSDNLDNSEFEMLIEKAVQKEITATTSRNTSFFGEFWNAITDSDIWIWIIRKIDGIVEGENINDALSWIAFDLQSKAAKSFVEAVFDEVQSGAKITPLEIISILQKSKGNSERDVVTETIRMLEQNNRKIQRRLNTSERKLRSQGQELFSSVYLPMEQLEELAINLRATKGEIKASLVATHLIDIVLSLREGFESLALQPLVDMDDWKYQNKITFDPEVHRVNAEHDTIPDKVRLNSLGFRYQDDDGEWQQYNAHASIEIDGPEKTAGVRKGYPKLEKPGQKKVRVSSARKNNKDYAQYFTNNKKKP